MQQVYNKSRALQNGVFGTGLSDKFHNTENVNPQKQRPPEPPVQYK